MSGPYKVTDKLPNTNRTVFTICRDGEYRTAKYADNLWRRTDDPWAMVGKNSPTYWWEIPCAACGDTGSISLLIDDNRSLQDELASLRAQVEQLTADAVIRANRQAILIDALKHIREFSLYYHDREIAQQVLEAIQETQP